MLGPHFLIIEFQFSTQSRCPRPYKIKLFKIQPVNALQACWGKTGHLCPTKGNLNASAYQDILDNSTLTVWRRHLSLPGRLHHCTKQEPRPRPHQHLRDERGRRLQEWDLINPPVGVDGSILFSTVAN